MDKTGDKVDDEPIVRGELDDDMRRLQTILDVQLALRERAANQEVSEPENEIVEFPAGSLLCSLMDGLVFKEQQQPLKVQPSRLTNTQRSSSTNGKEAVKNAKLALCVEEISSHQEIVANEKTGPVSLEIVESPNLDNLNLGGAACLAETSKNIKDQITKERAPSCKEKKVIRNRGENLRECSILLIRIDPNLASTSKGNASARGRTKKARNSPKASVSPSELEKNSVDQNFDFKSYLFKCYYCSTFPKQRTVGKIYTHWKRIHSNPIEHNNQLVASARPLSFEIEKEVVCFHCKKMKGELLLVCQHHYLTHKQKIFATRDTSNPLQCGECNYTVTDKNELLSHSEREHHHEDLMRVRERPNHLTDSMLQQLSGLPSGERNPNPIRYCCSKKFCGKLENDELKMAEHVLSHHPGYQCHFCDRLYQTPTMVLEHHGVIHHKNAPYRIPAANAAPYEQIRLMLPNGYTFTKKEAVGTRYGDMTPILNHIQTLKLKERDSWEPPRSG